MGAATPVTAPPLTPAYLNLADGQMVQDQAGKLVGVPNYLEFNVRLTLTQGTPVTTSDVTGALSLFLEPYNGDRCEIFDGTRWKFFTIAGSTYAIKATDSSQTGGTLTGSTITGLTSTAQLVPGMVLTNSTGTGTLGINPTIATIVSATSITINQGAGNVNGTLTNLTFTLAASTIYDVILVNDAGTLRLLWGPAYNNSAAGAGARASAITTQNGINVNSGSWTTGWTNGSASVPTLTGLLLGNVSVGATAGQLEDSNAKRFVSNVFNAVPRKLEKLITAASWSVSSTTFIQANSDTANQVACVTCLPGTLVTQCYHSFSTGSTTAYVCIGKNVTNAATGMIGISNTSNTEGINLFTDYPAIGLNFYAMLNRVSSGTDTFYGVSGGDQQNGMTGFVWN